MNTIIIFIAILALLVLSHEFGHFIAARRNGIKVEEFGFGFPPRIFGVQIFRSPKLNKIAEEESVTVQTETGEDGEIRKEIITDRVREVDEVTWKNKWRMVWGNRDVGGEEEENNGRAGTVYSLNFIPLGGFVKIKGEDGSKAEDEDSFAAKKFWQKATVLVAGVAMNIVLAAALLSAGYTIGLPQMVDDLPNSDNIKDRRLEIAQVLPDKPAFAAGIMAGDVVVGIDNLNYPRLKTMQTYINEHKDSLVDLKVERDGKIISKTIKPIVYTDTGRGGLGVALVEVGIVRYPWYKAIYYGTKETGVYLKEIILAFGYFFRGLFSGADVSSEMAGPVGIAVLTGRAARMGLAYLIQFTAVLSLNLALINILPIPALDGGRLLFIFISKLRRRPVNKNLEQWFHTVGFALLLLLVVFITVQDVSNFRGVITGFFKRIF